MNNEYTKIINELSSLTLENIHRKNQCDKPFYPLDLLSYLTLVKSTILCKILYNVLPVTH